MTERPRVTLQDVERVLPLKTWWAAMMVLPVVRRATLLVVNHTRLTPNAITVTSILLRVAAAGLFASGSRIPLVAGACAFYLAYVLDCMDGAVARLTKTSSEFGRFLDHIGDLMGGVLSIVGLAYGQGILFTPLTLGLLLCHVSEYYISFLTSTILGLKTFGTPAGVWATAGPAAYLRYRRFFHSRNMKSFVSFPDYEALVFFAFPLAGAPVLGLQLGFVAAVAVIAYTIFSSFVSVHADGGRFP